MNSADSVISLFTSLKDEIVLVADLASMRVAGVNGEARRLLDYDDSEMATLELSEIIECFRSPDIAGRKKELFSGGRCFSNLITSNSKELPVSFSMNLIRVKGKEYGVFIGRMMNLSAGTAGDTDFSPEKFMKVLDSINEAIVVIDRDMRIRLYNGPFGRLAEKFGYGGELVGTDIHDAADFLTGKHSLEYKFVFQSGKSLATSIKIKDSSKVLWFEVVKSPFTLNGEVTHVISVIRETTRQQELEQVKRESILQIEKNMEQFAILNDHIRNPLQAIVGLAELEGGSTAEKIIENAMTIDDIVCELDSGWIESDKIREMLLRHYGLKVSRRPNINSPIGMLTFVGTEENE